MIFPARVGNPSREEYAVLMNCILALAILGALGICFGWGGFTSLAFLWQLPLLFAALWLGLVLLAFLSGMQPPEPAGSCDSPCLHPEQSAVFHFEAGK